MNDQAEVREANPIANAARNLTQAREKKKIAKSMLDDFLSKDDSYSELTTQYDGARTRRRERKENLITNNDQGRRAADMLEKANEEFNEANAVLNEAIAVYHAKTGATSIDLGDGTKVVANVSYSLSAKQLELF